MDVGRTRSSSQSVSQSVGEGVTLLQTESSVSALLNVFGEGEESECS